MKPLLLLILASGPVLASDASVLQCRGVTEASARLACYDAIPVGRAAPAAPGAAAPATAAVATPAAAPAATATASAASVKAAEQSFGLPQKVDLDYIESSIPGKFEGWGPNQQFTLANGQVWRIADGSSAYYVAKDVKVKIQKKTFTNFMMIEGVNQSPNVRRVK